eukprot:g6060.t1
MLIGGGVSLEYLFGVSRMKSLLLAAPLFLAWFGGESLAQVCGTTGNITTRVEDAAGLDALLGAVNCTGTVDATWAGSITLDETIVIGSGTFLVITGEDSLAEVSGGALVRLFDVSESAGLSLLQLKLSGGTAENGGAIYSNEASISIDSCMFEGNVASGENGGAVWARGGELEIVGGSFVGNFAAGNGGAVWASEAELVVDGTVFESNTAEAEGGAVFCDVAEDATDAASGTVSCSFNGVEFSSNFATESGGAVYGGESSFMRIEGCTFENNHASTHGGAVVADSATLGGNTVVTNNEAAGRGGGVFARGHTGEIEFNDVLCSQNTAGEHGGCFYSAGRGIVTNETTMEENIAGADAANNSYTVVDGGRFTGCRSIGNGAFMFAADGALVKILGGTVTNSVAERRAGVVYCDGNSNNMGGSNVTIEGGTFTDNVALEVGGAIVGWASNDGEPSSMVVNITGGFFANNKAEFFGGFVFLEEMASLSCEGATVEDNVAGDQGGAIYAREAKWVSSSCDLIGNVAPMGAAAYLTKIRQNVTFTTHSITHNLTQGESAVYAAGTSIFATEVNFQSDAGLQETSSGPAVQLADATLVAEGCKFGGWAGDTVILNPSVNDSLVLDSCDFSQSAPTMVVSSPNSDAAIRNAFAGDLTVENAAAVNGTLVLIDRALSCDDDGACGEGGCVDSALGVLCECLEGGDCLHGGGALSVELKREPLNVTYYPEAADFELLISAAAAGTTSSIWELAFETDSLTIETLPSSGILPPGENVTVAVSASSQLQDVLGQQKVHFNVSSVGSDTWDSISVTMFYYLCRNFEYAVLHVDGSGDVDCEQCVIVSGAEGIDCGLPGATLETLPVRQGYWRSSNKSLEIHSCLHSDACAGATRVSSSDDYCQEGYTGPYCAVCIDGYGAGAGNTCYSCTSAKSRWLIVAGSFFALMALLFMIVAVAFLIGGLDAVDEYGEKMKRWASKVPLNKLKILVVIWQILTVFPSISSVNFPPFYSRFLSWIDFVNFDVGAIVSASCILPRVSFYHRLLLTTLGPLALALVLVVTFQMAKRRAGFGSTGVAVKKMAWSRHMAAGLLLSFLVFTSTSTIVFKTFPCDKDAVEGESYLRADYSLSCDSNVHMWFVVYAGIMTVVYPVGIPLLYAYILWTNRDSLNPRLQSDASAGELSGSLFSFVAKAGPLTKESMEELNEKLEKRMQNPDLVPSLFLWKDFGANMYYFEVIDCGRRILLTGVLIFIAPNTPEQAAIACMFAFASLLGFELLRPHLDPMDSWLYRLGCVVIFLSNFLALLIKVHSAEDQQTLLGVILVAVNVLLFLAVLLATWFATQQAVDDHRAGENTVALAGSMLTFELRAAASSRSIRERRAASGRSMRKQASSRENSTNGRSKREQAAPPAYSASGLPMREEAAPTVCAAPPGANGPAC